MSFYVLVPHVVVSYLSRYVFYGDKHVIKCLNNKNKDLVKDELRCN